MIPAKPRAQSIYIVFVNYMAEILSTFHHPNDINSSTFDKIIIADISQTWRYYNDNMTTVFCQYNNITKLY